MKLAFLISHPIQYYSPLFRELSKKIDLTVLYCSDESITDMKDKGFNKKIKWDIDLLRGYKYKFLKNNSPIKSIFKPPFGLINLEIKKEIKDYDAIIIHGWHYITHRLAIRYAQKYKIPYFIHSENPLNQELLKPKWKRMIKHLTLSKLFKNAAGCLAIGTENKRFYKYFGVKDNKIFFMPYAVDNKRFKKTKTWPKELPKNKKIILFSGKLIEKKRPFDLLKAYEMVKDKDKSLVFLGDGKLRKRLEKYVKDNKIKDVYFLGFKNQSKLPKYYSAADIFVLPSGLGETWGLVVNEAMNFSLPIIVSDVIGCSKDLVKDNGFIFEKGNINQLTSYLDKLLNNKSLREKMGKNSLKIIKNWSYKEDIEGILKAINTIK